MSRFSQYWKDRAVDTDEYEETDPMAKVGHSAKWDRCVEHVQATNPGADSYAVCTAMLGDESFKAMDEQKFNALIDKALENMEKDSFGVGSFGIAGAGPIPESKLSRQDLEGTTTAKKGIAGLVDRIAANQKAPTSKGGSFKERWSQVKAR